MLICTGFAQALDIVDRALVKLGVRRVALEDPSHPEMRRIFLDSGLKACRVPVDDEGVRVDVLEKTRAQAILVTPAHQFPNGVRPDGLAAPPIVDLGRTC
jgi:GntR family transcriptional regulator / MocR family aminotransferase